MKIAVVTPVYNGGKFLTAAMESVQSQTYPNLVHVVLDNASTDDTAAIIAKYANARVPVVTKRNGEVLKAPANWSEAVRLTPADVDYFKILCADDTMAPDAVEKLAKAAGSAADVRCVIGMDRFAGTPRWPNMPPNNSVFECSNMLARILSDNADIPFHHLMYRLDTRDSAADFFPGDVISFDAEAAFRVLAQGGRCAFVHEAIFDTIDHPGTLTATWTKKEAASHWEHLLRLERFGPAALTRFDYERVLRRHLRRFYRIIIWRFVRGRFDVAIRDLKQLGEHGYSPSLIDYAMSLIVWPGHLYFRKVKWRSEQTPWPAAANKPT